MRKWKDESRYKSLVKVLILIFFFSLRPTNTINWLQKWQFILAPFKKHLFPPAKVKKRCPKTRFWASRCWFVVKKKVTIELQRKAQKDVFGHPFWTFAGQNKWFLHEGFFGSKRSEKNTQADLFGTFFGILGAPGLGRGGRKKLVFWVLRLFLRIKWTQVLKIGVGVMHIKML